MTGIAIMIAAFSVAQITASIQAPSTTTEGASVDFSSVVTNAMAPYSVVWSMGTGDTLNGTRISYTYPDNGVYIVRLTVTDGSGKTTTVTRPIGVSNVSPTTIVNAPTSGTIKQQLAYSANTIDPSSVDQTRGFFYLWDFGDGGIAIDAAPGHAYVNPGTYTGNLTVYDKDGAAATTTWQTTISSGIDVSIGPDVVSNEGSPVTFPVVIGNTGTAPFKYFWNFGDGQYGFTATANQSHIYRDNGEYYALLYVEDVNKLSGYAIAKVTVTNIAPTVTISSPSQWNTNYPLTLIASVTDPSSQDWFSRFTYHWDFGDGTVLDGKEQAPQHAYTAPGTYQITVTATDKDGGVSAAKAVSVVLVNP